MTKRITLTQQGWEIYGEVEITGWLGEQGTIEMAPSFIPLGQLTKTRLVRTINDSGFGAESIDAADLRVYESYGHGDMLTCNLRMPRYVHIDRPSPSLVKRGI